MAEVSHVCLYAGEALGRYNFGDDHPFGPGRLPAFEKKAGETGLIDRACLREPVMANEDAILRFHTPEYVRWVKECSEKGTGYLDYGDTPAFPGVFEAASYVAGSVLDAAGCIIRGECRRGFVPIAGLHHARRDRAGGFCVFNDCGIVIEALLAEYGLKRIAYVDIDAHHGDGVFYSFEGNPAVIIADMHEDGRYLYPGTGFADETGRGEAADTKMNIPMPPGADDDTFFDVWDEVENFIRQQNPEFILLQCGADSIGGDPITHMRYSAAAHRHAALRLCALAEQCCQGRILAMGGGGYALNNLAAAWCAVLQAFLDAPAAD